MILTTPEKVKPAVDAFTRSNDITVFRDKIRGELGLPRRMRSSSLSRILSKSLSNSPPRYDSPPDEMKKTLSTPEKGLVQLRVGTRYGSPDFIVTELKTVFSEYSGGANVPSPQHSNNCLMSS